MRLSSVDEVVNNFPQCGRALNGASSLSMTGNSLLTAGQSGFQVKWMVTQSCSWQGLIHKWSAAMVRISVIRSDGLTWSCNLSTARIASTACCRGTKYSDCNSLPALGV